MNTTKIGPHAVVTEAFGKFVADDERNAGGYFSGRDGGGKIWDFHKMIHLIDSDAISVNCHARHNTGAGAVSKPACAGKALCAVELYICVKRLHGGLILKRHLGRCRSATDLIDTVVAVRIKDKDGHCNVDRYCVNASYRHALFSFNQFLVAAGKVAFVLR